MHIVDLRSDTVTKPTQAMRKAMADAEVGDDVFGEDPTVNHLQEKAAEMMGMEAALFVPTGTMANEIAVKVWTKPGDAVLMDEECHILHYELAGPAVLAGVQAEAVPIDKGIMPHQEITRRIRKADDHTPGTSLLCMENTHNRCGGTVLPVDSLKTIRELTQSHQIRLHMDGARFFNAVIAAGLPPIAWTRHIDSMMFCLSKGLCCPVGSLLVGSKDFIHEAHRVRKLFGGGMRQVGILAAAGLVALDTMIDRLAEDHRRARRLAEAIANIPGFNIDLETVQTNILYVQTERPAGEIERLLKEKGVLALELDPHRLRLITHHDIDDKDIDYAIDAFFKI